MPNTNKLEPTQVKNPSTGTNPIDVKRSHQLLAIIFDAKLVGGCIRTYFLIPPNDSI